MSLLMFSSTDCLLVYQGYRGFKMALLEIYTIACSLSCKIEMTNGTIYDVKDSGSFKEGDFVQLSMDKKTLCRPMCPALPPAPPNAPSVYSPLPVPQPRVRGLW